MFVSIVGATGVITASSHDVTGVVRNGAGDYSITLNQNYPAALSAFTIGPRTANSTDRQTIVHTSDTVKQLLTDLIAAATDQDCDVIGVTALA